MAQQQQNNRRPSQNPTEAKTKALSVKTFSEAARRFEEQFDRLLPMQIKKSQVMTGQRVTGLLVNLWMTNEAIRECPPSSVFNAVAMACAVGLEFNSALGQSYIIPYKKVATWQAGYRGLLTLAQRSEKVEAPYAQLVMPDDDFFDFEYGTSAFLRHKPGARNAGLSVNDYNQDIIKNFTHAYFYVKLRSGGHTFHVMDREDVLAIRDKGAQGVFDDQGNPKPSSPWNKYPTEMIRKTPTKQGLKYLDLTPHLSMATGLDDQADAGAPQDRVIEWKDYSTLEDLDHADEMKGYTQGTGDGPRQAAAEQGQATPEAGHDDPEAASDDTKAPFETWMFGKDLPALVEVARVNGWAQNQATFIGVMSKFEGTKGEFIKMLHTKKGGGQ